MRLKYSCMLKDKPQLLLIKFAQEYAQALCADSSISTLDKEDAVELLEAAVQELEFEKPKKVIVRTAMEK